MEQVFVKDVAKHLGKEVILYGWVFNLRSSGKIHFLQFRDGTGTIQGVVNEGSVGKKTAEKAASLTIESSVKITGVPREEKRAASGYEFDVKDISIVQIANGYPIGKKEHGVDFLLDQRHLWVRSERQRAIAVLRDEIIWALREFFREEGFRLTDTPILTPTSCEGTTTLFETDYFGEPAYLSQSGQLYLEAMAMSLGKVYDFGPVFRAEKSKTRRHLTEFWMLDAEQAFAQFEDNLKTQERLLSYVAKKLLERCEKEFAILERDLSIIKNINVPFPRLTYHDAIIKLQELGSDIKIGEDFGNDDETLLMNAYKTPLFVTHFPVSFKAFYMQPDPKNPDVALCDDLLLPEGYGEVMGGSERIHDASLLLQRIKEHKLSEKEFAWYVDLRRYGSVPHAGFGVGLERLVTYFAGLQHVRESIAFPRLLNRLRP